MATASTEHELREVLRGLGERRRQAETDSEELTGLIKDALKKAGRAGITKSDAARLLGVHRTTLYRVYDL